MTIRTCLVALNALPTWSRAELEGLDGRVKGVAFKGWADLLTRRWGPEAVASVRAQAGLCPEALPDAPPGEADYPIHWQLRVTRAIVDAFGAGDLTCLEGFLADEGLGRLDRVKRRLLRLTLRPAAVLRGADRIYAALYSPGFALAEVRGRAATLRWAGAAFHAEPTWRALQVVAVGTLFQALGNSELEVELVEGRDPTASFNLALRW